MLLANGRFDPSIQIKKVLSLTRNNARRLEAWGYRYKACQSRLNFFSLLWQALFN
jgi:hypothetical protein